MSCASADVVAVNVEQELFTSAFGSREIVVARESTGTSKRERSYLGHKKRADSSGRENTFVADKVRELDVQATADSRPDLPCKLDGKLDGKLDCKLDSQSEQGEPSKGTALQATADAVLDLLNLEAEIIREGSDEPLCKKRRLLNNKMKVALAEGTRALLEISRDGMQLV